MNEFVLNVYKKQCATYFMLFLFTLITLVYSLTMLLCIYPFCCSNFYAILQKCILYILLINFLVTSVLIA